MTNDAMDEMLRYPVCFVGTRERFRKGVFSLVFILLLCESIAYPILQVCNMPPSYPHIYSMAY